MAKVESRQDIQPIKFFPKYIHEYFEEIHCVIWEVNYCAKCPIFNMVPKPAAQVDHQGLNLTGSPWCQDTISCAL